jgi:hypothetical protein
MSWWENNADINIWYCGSLHLHLTHANYNTLTRSKPIINEEATHILEARIAQWYSAEVRAGWSRVRVPAGAGNFSLHHRVQNGSGAHPVSYAVGTRGSFLERKTAVAWSWPPPVSRSRMRGAISLLSQYVFMALCSVKSTETTSCLPITSQCE